MAIDAPALDGPGDAPVAPEIAYLEDIHPVFEAAGCGTFACHGSTLGGAGLLVYMPDARIAYDDMIDRVSVRRPEVIVAPGAPAASVLVEHAEMELVDAAVLTEEEAALVRRWVAAGAAFSRGGASPDAGPADAGVPVEPTTCDLSAARGWSELPAACLPRCTTATWDAIVACRSEADPNACQNTVIAADGTASTQATGGVEPFAVDCGLCLGVMTRSCIEEHCPMELLAVDRCATFRTGDPCTAEGGALNACRIAHPEAQACQRVRDPRCAGAE